MMEEKFYIYKSQKKRNETTNEVKKYFFSIFEAI